MFGFAPVKVLLLGDVHGHLPRTDRPTWEFLAELVDASPWPCLQAGDIGRYPPLRRPLYFIFGNNDWPPAPKSPAYVNLRPGEPVVLAAGSETLTVAGLNGVYDPAYYARPELIPAAERGLFFTPADVAACTRLRNIDIFLAHGVPAGFGLGREPDHAVPALRELLEEIRPRFFVCGHAHRFASLTDLHTGTRVIVLGELRREFYILDTASGELIRVPTAAGLPAGRLFAGLGGR